MLEPRKTKFRKQHKGTGGGKKSRGTDLSIGQYGLKAMESGTMSSRQIEAVRQILSRATKKGGKLWIRVFPDRPITFKGTEVPMGGGKGDVIGYEVPVGSGKILFELDGIDSSKAKETFRLASHKLGIKTKFITRSL